jgi:hypothetical protein
MRRATSDWTRSAPEPRSARTVVDVPAAVDRAARTASSTAAADRRAAGSIASPAGVSRTERVVRRNSATSSSVSSCWIVRLRACWETNSRRAAAVKLSSSATATKSLRCRSSGIGAPGRTNTPPVRRIPRRSTYSCRLSIHADLLLDPCVTTWAYFPCVRASDHPRDVRGVPAGRVRPLGSDRRR